MPMQITKDELKWFLVEYQGLGRLRQYEGKSGVMDFMNQVGCIQYDPLNVVGRNSDLVLQSRVKGYKAHMLEALLYEDRALIDGWDKQMSIYTAGDWARMQMVRDAMTLSTEKTLNKRKSHGALEYVDQVKEELNKTGPARPSAIDLGQVKRGSWGHGKISSVVLDYLFHRGDVGVHSKSGTQKIYDFIENLLDEEQTQTQDIFASENDFMDWYVKRRIGSIGMYWAKSGDGWLGKYLSVKKNRMASFERLVEAGDLLEVQVESLDDMFYIRKEDMPFLERIAQNSQDQGLTRTSTRSDDSEHEVRFIAPLDNLIWDRKLIRLVYDFDYVWEVYKPVADRKFGYYVLPVLYKNHFIGRFEPDHLKGGQVLKLKNWWWEEGTLVDDRLRQAVIKAFDKFATYLGVDEIDADFDKLLK